VFSAVTDGNGNIIDYVPNAFDTPAPSFSPDSLFPVERTYSEWLMSDYNSPAGIPSTAFGGNKANVATCQDCHMRDTTGQGCNKNPPVRDDLPMHDMTGGNTFIPKMIDTLWPSDGVDTAALNAGVERALYMLQNAATMTVNQNGQQVDVHIINETGHKLPTGYPEGRRAWINIKAWGANGEYYESGHYNFETAVLSHDEDAKIYEIKPGISHSLSPIVGVPAGPSFHFVLNDTIYSDNRIPPRGFTNANFKSVQAQPVDYSYADGDYWDDTQYNLSFLPTGLKVTFYYQTTSKEYVEFLRDENISNDWGDTMYDMWVAHGKSKPVVMQEVEIGQPFIDLDNDGYPVYVDCEDDEASIHPGAPELPDCEDNDCDGKVDEDFTSEDTFVWTGCEDTDNWNDPENWNLLAVPGIDQHVIIPGDIQGSLYPVIASAIEVKSLQIENNATLEVALSHSLTVDIKSLSSSAGIEIQGQLINRGVLLVQNTIANGINISDTGSFTNYGTCTIQAGNQTGIENGGILTNETTGVLVIMDVDGYALYNTPLSQFTNKGQAELKN
jgi:hypothetical protein